MLKHFKIPKNFTTMIDYVCCDIGQNDTIDKIELIHFSDLSSRDLNCHDDIQLFLQQFENFRVNGDTGRARLIQSHSTARF